MKDEVKVYKSPVCLGKVGIVRNTTGKKEEIKYLRLIACQSGLSTCTCSFTSQQLIGFCNYCSHFTEYFLKLRYLVICSGSHCQGCYLSSETRI